MYLELLGCGVMIHNMGMSSNALGMPAASEHHSM